MLIYRFIENYGIYIKGGTIHVQAVVAQSGALRKDQHFREFALHDNMWKVILYVGTPLALYQSLNQLFKIF